MQIIKLKIKDTFYVFISLFQIRYVITYSSSSLFLHLKYSYSKLDTRIKQI